ncbi:MAG TPA: energy transducer TonB [Terriglobales bacterium]|nr:energy transducer TonB [Terriglobales bacterium]
MSDQQSDRQTVDQLDAGIQALLLEKDTGLLPSNPAVAELLAVAVELRTLPRASFKADLQAALLGETPSNAYSAAATGTHGLSQQALSHRGLPQRIADPARVASLSSDLLPTVAVPEHSLYPVQRSSFMTSLAAHALILALLITSGIWAAPSFHEKTRVSSSVVLDIGSYVLPPATDRAGGGGGGGDSDVLQASKGSPPRFAREQITPPAIVVRNEDPKLEVEPTVVGPPALSFPQTSQMGDPFAHITGPPSNGAGTNGGIGSGAQGGVGMGNGPGVGDGWGGGIGRGLYRAGGGVSAPRPIYDPEPDYSEEARKAKYQGSVVLQIVVGADGLPKDMRIARSLGMGLDEKALEAVRQWRFEPGTLNGHAVPVVVNVEVNFRLY